MSTPEDPMDRLRAADPAADVAPSAGFAERVVARAMSDDAASTTAATSAPIDLSAERERRRPRRLLAATSIAAGVAVALVVGGAAGYGFGVGQQPPGTTTAAAPEIGAGETAIPEIGGGLGPTPSTPSVDSAVVDRMIWPGYSSGRRVFHASGLSTLPGTSEVYAYDPRAVSPAELIAALSAALGLEEGTPELRDGSWQLIPLDGSAPELWVGVDSTLSFWYSHYDEDFQWECLEGDCDVPSEDEAIRIARELMEAVGQDAADFEFTSTHYEGSRIRNVTAGQLVDGAQIGQTWSFELAGDGIRSVYGALAPLVSLGEYPVVSEQEAFERMTDPRFGTQQIHWADPGFEIAASTEVWVPPTEAPAPPAPGSAISWPVAETTLVSARLGWLNQWVPTGDGQSSSILIPAYEFTDTEGGVWSVVALADEVLDFTSAAPSDVTVFDSQVRR